MALVEALRTGTVLCVIPGVFIFSGFWVFAYGVWKFWVGLWAARSGWISLYEQWPMIRIYLNRMHYASSNVPHFYGSPECPI